MRKSSVRRAALHATAKIALGSAAGIGLGLLLPSCGGEAISSAEPESATSGTTEAGGASSGGRTSAAGGVDGVGGTLASGGASVGGTDLACVGPVELIQPLGSPPPSEADFNCCLDFVVAAQSEGRPIPGHLEASTENCCRLILHADFARQLAVSQVHSTCCSIIPGNQLGQIFSVCAPWGPPVPPALDWEAA